MCAGDESINDEQQAPELDEAQHVGEWVWEDDVDPMNRPCDECGAEPHEACRPACTANS